MLISVALVPAQVPEWLWVNGAGSSYSDYGYDVATDSYGNSYITGSFCGTATFGSVTLTVTGSILYTDIFLAKADSSGNWLWAISAGGTGHDNGYDIAIDAAGNCYVTGTFRETAAFGITNISSAGYADIFIAKADANGIWLWAKRGGGTDIDWGNGVAADDDGTCYITGYFAGTADFGAASFTSRGNYDIYAAKLDTNGNWLWATQVGSQSEDYALGISSDGNGNAYVTGYFYTGTISNICYFDAIELQSDNGYDIFVAKVNSIGTWQWAKKAGGDSHDYSYAISTNSSGTSFITGRHQTTSDFGAYILTEAGGYIAGISAGGTWLWAAGITGNGTREGKDVCADDQGNCYTTGLFTDDAYFGNHYLDGYPNSDTYTAKLDGNGNWLWAVRAGGTSNDNGNGVSVDGTGHCYVTGQHYGYFYCGSYLPPNYGQFDIYLAKLSAVEILIPDPPTNIQVTQTSTHVSLAWDSITGAASYNVYACDDPDGTFQFLLNTTDSAADITWAEITALGFDTGVNKVFFNVRADTD